ncbi:MAG: chromosome segregation protein SMC [Clostridiales bacterium]|nr:chromosome segregation protein SMC [Clostridiales bacterium]
MRLKKLFIHGFKSFADRVEITFEHGITGVVGPNGCGKSNIADAIRWVLGEQSAKQLRGTKMEDVIFNGTDKRRRLGYCEVSLTFDNEDHALPIDYTEVSVTRRAYRTGESEYVLNGQNCRLKDIVDLFRDTGTGRDGYSIVGQGRVDEILSQKTEERRQVFEEAAGIVKFKTRKTESEKRLEATQLNLDRVSDIIDDLEQRLEPLRLQSEDARKFLKLRDELKGLELNAFVLKTDRYSQKLAEYQENTLLLRQEADQNESERLSLGGERDAYQDTLARGEEESASLRVLLQEQIRDVEAGEGAAGVLRERINGQEREKQRLLSEMEAAKNGESGLRERTALLENEYADFMSALEAERWASGEKDEQLLREEALFGDLSLKADEAKESVINAMNGLSDAKSEQARLSALSGAIDEREERLKKALDEIIASGDSYERAYSDAQNQLEAEKLRLEQLSEDTKRLSEETRLSGEEYEKTLSESGSVMSRRQELSSRFKLLSEMQRDYEGYNSSVKQVLLEARRRGMKSVHGVVANIIHADKDIEKAIETALGPALQNIVVDTEEDAREFIEFLKANRLGRATFLPISAVRGRTLDANERSLVRMPGGVGIASEMVSFDKRYQGIVDSLLGRTVIAKDLQSGIPIHRAGRQQFRLVTLDGDVMNVGGSMTGGSSVSRMTSLLSREREINETEAALKDLEARLSEYQEKLNRISRARAEMKAQRQEAFDAFHQQEIAVTRAEAHLSRAGEEKAAWEEKLSSVTTDIGSLREQKTRIAEELERLSHQTENTKEESERMRVEAARLQNELNAQRLKLDALRNEATDRLVRLTALQKDAEKRQSEIERLKAQAGSAETLLRQAEAQLTRLDAQATADREELERQEALLGAARSSLDETREKFNAADKLRLDAQEKLRSINAKMEELSRLGEETSERLHRVDLLTQRAQGELDTMTARIWEDYQLTYEGAKEFSEEDFRLSEGEKRISAIRGEIKKLGDVNVSSMDEYREVSRRYADLTAQRDDLSKARDDLLDIIGELSQKMEKQFREKLAEMDKYFSETFSALFGGGQARLSLEDPSDALNSGIVIQAQPPGKKLQLLSLLSGGERALTAIAILFAMLKLKPTPFCMLDEIEAALDDANIDNFASYLKTYSDNTQFVVVTHRKGTMAACDALYGVAMEEKGVSKLVSVKLGE